MITINFQNPNGKLDWLLYDSQANLVGRMCPHPLPLSRSFGRGVSRQRRGEGSCANLGHPEDETGLVYMRARYYEPATGRFISEDPGRDGVNWYLYAEGNPVNKADGNGKNPLLIAALVGFVLGFLSGAVTTAIGGGSAWQIFIGGLAGGLGGAVAGLTGGWIAGLAQTAWGDLFASALGGSIGSFVTSILGDLFAGRSINWGKAMRAAGIGGLTGAVLGVVAFFAYINEIEGALLSLDADLVSNAVMSAIENHYP